MFWKKQRGYYCKKSELCHACYVGKVAPARNQRGKI